MYMIDEFRIHLLVSLILSHGMTEDMCTDDREVGKKLPVSPFTVLFDIGFNSCFKECEAYAICLSINFNRIHFMCEMNREKRNESLNLVDDDSFIYKEIPGILEYQDKKCGDGPCNEYSKCVHTEVNGYICITIGCNDVIPDLQNGKIAKKTFYPPSVTFECNPGYSGSDASDTITCSPWGKWSTLLYECGVQVNGGWGAWQAWTPCYQVSCWFGTKLRTRPCNNPLPIYGGQYCSGNPTEIINCLRGQCPDIRLVGGTSISNGRVELNDNGQWVTVCHNRWSDLDAAVICRMLGYFGPARGLPNAFYGQGTGRIWLTNVTCAGYEPHILQCHHSKNGQSNCNHSQDASVSCT